MDEKKLTIFFVTNNYLPYSAGVVSSIDATAQQLRLLGHRVVIITLDFGYDASAHDQDVVLVPCEIKFRYGSNPLAFPLFSSSFLRDLVHKNKPDIMHVHHPFLLGSSAARVARKNNIPLILTLHMLYENHTHHVPLPQGLMRQLARHQVWRFCRKVSRIIAPSSAVEHYLNKGNIISNISIIPSGILPIFKNDEVRVKKTKPFELLYVGRFVVEKKIDELLEVFALLPRGRYHFTIAGFGTEFERLKAYAYHELGLPEDEVTFINHPTKKELVDLYRTSSLFLFASRSETQGMVLAESMASGTAVVAFHGIAIDDIVKDGYNGRLVHTKEEMAQAITELAQNEELLARMNHHALQTAQSYYPEVTVQKLVTVYRDLLLDRK